ncbi:MAG: hypothetical protein WA173_10635 [Pseudomonas sp.]|uniref:hypothetical protein n=1 Tax=Pseudomonas sp. TaxID=306 RepID=UPI003BB4FEA7
MKQLLATLLACALLILSGCLSYSNHDLALVEQWPPAAPLKQKASAYVKVDTQYLFNGENRPGGFNQAGLEKLILQQYQSSERFSRATTSKETSDLYVSIRVSNHERGSIASALLTGFTLFVIPGTYSNELTMETTFKDASGKVLGRVEKHESITTWIQLLLIVTLPFNASTDNVLTQLTQSSLEEASRQKLI